MVGSCGEEWPRLIVDKGGTTWWIATHIEDVSSEEIQRRATQQFGGA